MGGQPAPDGLLIEARVRWYRSDTVKTFGGKYQGLFVSPNDWALQGAPVTFHIGESQAVETATYNGRTLSFDFNHHLTFP